MEGGTWSATIFKYAVVAYKQLFIHNNGFKVFQKNIPQTSTPLPPTSQ